MEVPALVLVKNSVEGGAGGGVGRVGSYFPRIVVCNSIRIMVYVHFTYSELVFFLYLKHLPVKLYFPANTHLGRKYLFSLC